MHRNRALYVDTHEGPPRARAPDMPCKTYDIGLIFGSIWSVKFTDEFQAWYATLTDEQQEAIAARVELLEQHGPNLKRPTVGEVLASRYAPQMKELRISEAGQLRVLFIFDPRRGASVKPFCVHEGRGGSHHGRTSSVERAAEGD